MLLFFALSIWFVLLFFSLLKRVTIILNNRLNKQPSGNRKHFRRYKFSIEAHVLLLFLFPFHSFPEPMQLSKESESTLRSSYDEQNEMTLTLEGTTEKLPTVHTEKYDVEQGELETVDRVNTSKQSNIDMAIENFVFANSKLCRCHNS